MASLKQKLAFSYGILIFILFGVSAWGIYHLVELGRSIDVILVNNYKSILAAENMKEALERQDSAALFFIAGQTENARQQFESNDSRFAQELAIATNNVTESGEPEIIADIKAQYQAYRSNLEIFINLDSAKAQSELSAIYFDRLEPVFLTLKNRLDDLLRLNQQAMVAANERAISDSVRAQISTIVAAGLALVLAVVFAWGSIKYVVNPISEFAEKARRAGEGDFDQHLSITSKDEIGVLATEFNRMLTRLRDLRRSDYGRLLVEQKKSDAVIDSIYEPVIVTDAAGHVIKINHAGRSLFSNPTNGNQSDDDVSLSGFTGGEHILRAVRDVVSMQRPVAGEVETALVPIKVKGAERSFRLRAMPMRDIEGRLLGAVTVLEDITAMKEVDRMKDEFISVASVKLCEPLRALQLALHTVSEGHTGEMNDKQADMLSIAREKAEKIEEILRDLLELTEIESGRWRLSTERLRPIDMARAAIERFRAVAACRDIKLDNKVWPDLPWVVGDRKAVARILDNLLSNALRHTERGGLVTIEAGERPDRVYFSVRDTGEGIPDEHLPSVFNRFSHIGNRPGGTGLGLALVKRLVEAQGGQISVESHVGEGTTFTFTMLIGGPASIKRTRQQTDQA